MKCNRAELFVYNGMKYDKPALDIPAQISILQQRGLVIQDIEEAERFLNNVSYFRFAAYLRVFENPDRTFRTGSTFENAAALCSFDSELRKLIFGAVQKIEIALRSRIIHQFSLAHGPFWFLNPDLAADKLKFSQNLATIERELERSKEDFIKEHTAKYGTTDFPPSWKMLELVSFGCLTKLYFNFSDSKAKKKVCRSFGVHQPEAMESWMKATNVLRNWCAHHARVWNRVMPVMPQNINRTQGKWISDFPKVANNAYAILSCIAYWLYSINPQNSFVKDLKRLFRKYPSVAPSAMEFKKGWRKEPLWNQ